MLSDVGRQPPAERSPQGPLTSRPTVHIRLRELRYDLHTTAQQALLGHSHGLRCCTTYATMGGCKNGMNGVIGVFVYFTSRIEMAVDRNSVLAVPVRME